MAKGKWYDISFIVDGYIVLRVQAENEDDAEEMASLELNKALEASKGFWKYELDYPDGPFIEEVMDVDWQGFQVKPLPEPQPGQPLRGGDRPSPLPEARPPQEITKADKGEAE